jgi:hypothetical protein
MTNTNTAPAIRTVIDLDGFRFRARIVGTDASIDFSRNADRACGLHRENFADCTARECGIYEEIKRDLRAWMRRKGIETAAIHTSDGIYLASIAA